MWEQHPYLKWLNARKYSSDGNAIAGISMKDILEPQIHVDYKQVNMKEGRLDQLTKVFPVGQTEVTIG